MRTIKALVLTLPALMFAGEALSVMAISAVLAAPAQAASKETLSPKVGKVMVEADKLYRAKDFKGAMAKLREAQALEDKTDYEKLTISEYVVAVAASLGDNKTALKALEDLVSINGSDAKQLPQRLKQLTLLSYQDGNYDKTIQFGNRYLKEVGADLDVSISVMQSYYQKKDYQHALDASQGVIKTAQASGQPIKEGYYQIQLNSYTNLGRDQEAIAVLEKLLAEHPTKEYWKIIIGNLESGGGLSDRAHVELYRLKQAAGVLEAKEIVQMAELALAIGTPGDAKSVLESGFASKDLGTGPSKERENKLLNKARLDSDTDQKTLDAQAHQAANSAKGDLDTKIGEAYASYGQYDKAIEAINRGLKKGGVAAEDEAYLHLGEALFASKKYGEAANAFKAVKSDSKYARIAHLWMILANNKK